MDKEDILAVIFTTTLAIGAGWAGVRAMDFVTTTLGLPASYHLIPIFGGLGGIAGGPIRAENQLILCHLEELAKLQLGLLGDVVGGIAGAFAAAFLYAGLGLDVSKAESYPMIISISVLAGAFAQHVLETGKDKFLKEAKAAGHEAAARAVARPAASTFAQRAEELLEEGDFEEAERAANEAIAANRESTAGHLAKARALHRQGRTREALALMKRLLDRQFDPVVAYNIACYQCVLATDADALPKHRDDILRGLRGAFEAKPHLRALARKDSDLEGIGADAGFQALLEEET